MGRCSGDSFRKTARNPARQLRRNQAGIPADTGDEDFVSRRDRITCTVSQSLQPVQSQHAETPDAYATHKAWLSNLGLFLIHGLVVSTWVSRIPAIQAKLHLQNGILGVALLGAAIGALTAIPIAGTLVAKHGSRMISIVATVLFCVTLIFPA